MRNLYALFLIIPLILSIGIAPALPFANAGMSDVVKCAVGQTLAKNLQHGYYKCMESSKADRFAQLGIVELVTVESEKETMEETTEEESMEKPKVEEPAKEETAPVELLFVQMATSGTFTKTDDGYSLVLDGVNPQTIYFSDRPNRITGHITTEDFVNNWGLGNNSFESDPPNAAITILGADETEDTIIVELTNPVFNSEMRKLQYTVQILEDTSDGLSHYTEHVDESLPESFGHVAVFIDDAFGFSCDCPPAVCFCY